MPARQTIWQSRYAIARHSQVPRSPSTFALRLQPLGTTPLPTVCCPHLVFRPSLVGAQRGQWPGVYGIFGSVLDINVINEGYELYGYRRYQRYSYEQCEGTALGSPSHLARTYVSWHTQLPHTGEALLQITTLPLLDVISTILKRRTVLPTTKSLFCEAH